MGALRTRSEPDRFASAWTLTRVMLGQMFERDPRSLRFERTCGFLREARRDGSSVLHAGHRQGRHGGLA